MQELQKVWPFGDVPSDEISIYEGPRVFLDDYAATPVKQRTVIAAYWLQAEVLNGGLHQFFSNDTGVLAPEAVAACRALSMPALAGVTERAMAWFGEPYPRERETRQAALTAFSETHGDGADPFADFDDEIADLIYEENGGLELAASRYLGTTGDS
jgi:hypothetical protein